MEEGPSVKRNINLPTYVRSIQKSKTSSVSAASSSSKTSSSVVHLKIWEWQAGASSSTDKWPLSLQAPEHISEIPKMTLSLRLMMLFDELIRTDHPFISVNLSRTFDNHGFDLSQKCGSKAEGRSIPTVPCHDNKLIPNSHAFWKIFWNISDGSNIISSNIEWTPTSVELRHIHLLVIELKHPIFGLGRSDIEVTQTCSSFSNQTLAPLFWLQTNGHRTSNFVRPIKSWFKRII